MRFFGLFDHVTFCAFRKYFRSIGSRHMDHIAARRRLRFSSQIDCHPLEAFSSQDDIIEMAARPVFKRSVMEAGSSAG